MSAARGPYLNVGSNEHGLPGFVNLDLLPLADVQADATRGLPFRSGSLAGVYSEHFIEHISQAAGAAFFRECRRVLRPGGRIRIATPDLDFIVRRYLRDDWKSDPEFARFGLDWIANRCEQLNVATRHWGHLWMYDEEELTRLATMAGLEPVGRQVWGDSMEPAFRGLEHREGSRLIVEFVKAVSSEPAEPLVSILIPAYNPRYFVESLQSALAQTYGNLEIVVGDDCPTDAIRLLFDEHAASGSRVRYCKHQSRVGDRGNYVRLLAEARGDYVKYLNDDDRLEPRCVERMASCLREHPDVTLVTSHRRTIDSEGATLPEDAATRRLVAVDSVIDGTSLVDEMLLRRINLVGEPTTVMFRRRDMLRARPDMFSFAGRPALANGDMTMWVNLLAQGNLIYLAETLSCFRRHTEQRQREPGFADLGQRAWQQLFEDARRMGFLRPSAAAGLGSRALDWRPWWPAAVRSAAEACERHLRRGELVDAATAADRALELEPDDPALLTARALVLLEAGSLDKAHTCFERASVIAPHHAPAHTGMAAIAVCRGDVPRARRHLTRALELDPANAEARTMLAGTRGADSSPPAEGARFALDRPTTGEAAYETIGVEGWLLLSGRHKGSSPRLELRLGGTAVPASTAWIARPDVAREHPDLAPLNPRPGFEIKALLHGSCYGHTELTCVAIFGDRSQLVLGSVVIDIRNAAGS